MIGILGGGLAGLTIAAHLELPGEVLEKESRGGGHCQTVQEQGFTYDAGGPHVIFSRNQEMVDYMGRPPRRQCSPRAPQQQDLLPGALRKISF